MAKRNKSALKANRQNIERREANRQLRSKLGERAPIVTIRGVGYKADDRAPEGASG